MTQKKQQFKTTSTLVSKKQFTSLTQRPRCKRQNSIQLIKRYTRLIK